MYSNLVDAFSRFKKSDTFDIIENEDDEMPLFGSDVSSIQNLEVNVNLV